MKLKEAFEILRDTPIDIRSAREDDIHSLYATAQNMALDALQRQMWIPCSERLPEESGKYLGQLDWGNITDIFFSKKWQKWNAHDSQEPKHAIEVVAWMPLPEPYKEGDIDG